MTEAVANSVRLRACVGTGCRLLFTVCASCDRGPSYCGDVCRKAARQRQVRAASSRYHASDCGP